MRTISKISDLNNLPGRPPKPYVKIEGDTTKPMKVSVIESYADNPLIVGPRYQMEDFKYHWAQYPGKKSSGVVCKLFIIFINAKSVFFSSTSIFKYQRPNKR